jgi:hypothetical protein
MIEKFDGEHQLFHANPEPYTIRFQGDTGELGKLIYGPEGELTFEGEADECAQIFFDHVIECNNSNAQRPRIDPCQFGAECGQPEPQGADRGLSPDLR